MKTFNSYYESEKSMLEFVEKNQIKDSSKLLIQVFTGENNYKFIKNLIQFLSSIFPKAALIGSTTDGEINEGKVSTNKTTISFTSFEKTVLQTFISNKFANFFEAGSILASKLIQEDTKALICFIDGLIGNGEEFLKGIDSINNEIIVSGGLAGDNSKFEQTYVFTKDSILLNAVVGVSLSSQNLSCFTDYSFNWLSIGKKLKITKADKNRVYTINNKTAVETFAYYLGKNISKQLPAIGIEFPLIIEKDGIEIARAVIGKKDDDSLIFAGNLKKGDEVKFGYGNANQILDKTQIHVDKLLNKAVESIFIYSCMARRRFMPDKIENETLVYNNIAPTCGFFTNGEFFSTKDNKKLLNQTMTILALSESNEKNTTKVNVEMEKSISTTVQALSHLIHVSTKELEKKDELLISQSRNAAMGEMLNIVAHQWRQPLSVISMTANNLLMDIDLDSLDKYSTKEYTNTILKESSNLSNIIDNFRNYFEPEDKKEFISLETIIENIKNIVQTSLNDNKINLIIQNSSNAKIYAHKQHLMQVLLNLINNCKDAFLLNKKEKKVIIISVKEENEKIILDVCDNAGGIDSTIINDIFDPYFTTKNQLNGTGLGLYMSKIVIEKYMNGKISVENKKDGACFTIILKT